MPTEAIVAGNKVYPNAVVAIQIEDQYNSHLNVMDFVTVSHDLVGTPGLTKKVRRYRANLNKTEILAKGEGNTEGITVDYIEDEYKVQLLQNYFPYNDEDAMEDDKIVETGANALAVDMYNKADELCMAEFNKTENVVVVPNGKFDFDAFVDGAAEFPALAQESGQPALNIFGWVHPADVKDIRKNLKDDLKYVEAYVRTGYIGTINGISLYTKATATEGAIVLATKKAVKYENKKGTEVEFERASANNRLNKIYSRKVGLFYLEHEDHCIKLVKNAG